MNNNLMSLKEAVDSLKLKFKSGNDIEVERTTITRKEWEPIISYIERQNSGSLGH